MKDEFLQSVAKNLRKKEDFEAFFSELLTPKEYHDIIERFAICKSLSQKKTVREVCEELGVASATVVRGNRLLKYGGEIIHKLVK